MNRRIRTILSLPLLSFQALAAEAPDFLSLQHKAAQGDASAQETLGELFIDGKIVAKDEMQAAAWFRRAAEGGYAAAQARLGRMLWKGVGVPADLSEAETWLRRAVAQADARAQEDLNALLAETPDRRAARDRLALEARFKAAAENRTLRSPLTPPAVTDRAVDLRGTLEEAKWYFKSAQGGNPAAMRNLGLLYLKGEGVKADDVEGYEWIKKAAGKKDVVGQWALGVLLLTGRGAAKDEAAAVRAFKSAADQGDALSQRALGWMRERGRGGPANAKEAARFYGMAAKQNDPWARTALGRLNEEGRGVPKNTDEALALYRAAAGQDFIPALVDEGLLLESRGKALEAHSLFAKAAEGGDAAARYHLGVLFETGKGALRDEREADRLYDVAAYAGVMDAQVRRARLLEAGRGGVKRDVDKAVALFRDAADGARHPLAILTLGLMQKDEEKALGIWKPLAEDGDPLAAYWAGRAASGEEATRLLRKSAEAGEPRAQALLGAQLADRKRAAEALPWLEKAAEAGEAEAAVRLARLHAKDKDAFAFLLKAARSGDRASQKEVARRFQDGVGVPEDAAQAAAWYRMAAVQGDAASQVAVANFHLSGDGVPLDPVEAARWLTRAAEGGNVPAQRDLAMLYEKGLGVRKDAAKAVQWYRKAAAGGDAYAKKKVSAAR